MRKARVSGHNIWCCCSDTGSAELSKAFIDQFYRDPYNYTLLRQEQLCWQHTGDINQSLISPSGLEADSDSSPAYVHTLVAHKQACT
jgi:hypothetical protein